MLFSGTILKVKRKLAGRIGVPVLFVARNKLAVQSQSQRGPQDTGKKKSEKKSNKMLVECACVVETLFAHMEDFLPTHVAL